MDNDRIIREVYEVLESRRDNPIDSYTWQLYNNFIVNIDPTNTYIINALLNFDNPQEAIENYFYNNNKFNYVYI